MSGWTTLIVAFFNKSQALKLGSFVEGVLHPLVECFSIGCKRGTCLQLVIGIFGEYLWQELQ
jgi:hypothetical protein